MPTKMTKTIPHMIEAKLVIPENFFWIKNMIFFAQNTILIAQTKGEKNDRKKDGSHHSPSSQRVYSACSQGSLSDDYIQDVMRSDMIYNKIT